MQPQQNNDRPGHMQKSINKTIRLAPNSDSTVFLGYFGKDSNLKGFAVEITPNNTEQVKTNILNASADSYALSLYIANASGQDLTAQVVQLP